MRNTLLLTLALLTGCHNLGVSDTLKVMTFNIRYGTAPDGADDWQHRRGMLFALVRRERADFLDMQEALRFQVDEIVATCPGYSALGVGRDDGRSKGEMSPILYNHQRFALEDSGTFWLSDTPAVPGSMTWGNHYPRLVTWGRFRQLLTERTFYVYNTHFDHESQPARLNGAQLLMTRIAQRRPVAPFVLTGDFNAAPANDAIQRVLHDPAVPLIDTFAVNGADATEQGTFHAFTGERTRDRIDYIFVPPSTQVISTRILHDQDGGHYPSDHFPVTSTIRW